MLSYKPIFFYTLKDSYQKHVQIFPYVDYLVGTDAKDVTKNEFVIYPQSSVTDFGIFNQQKIGEKPTQQRTWDQDLYVSNENMKTTTINFRSSAVAQADTIKRALFCWNYDQLDSINDGECVLSDPKKAKVIRLDKGNPPHVNVAAHGSSDEFNPRTLLKRLNDVERKTYRQKQQQQQQLQQNEQKTPVADSSALNIPTPEIVREQPQPTDDELYEYLLTQNIDGLLNLNNEWINGKYNRTGLLTIAPISYLLIVHTIKDDFFGHISDQTFRFVSTLRNINAKGESYGDEALMSEFALSLLAPYIQRYTYVNFDVNVFTLPGDKLEYILKNFEHIQQNYLNLLSTIFMDKDNDHYPTGTQATYALCTSDLYIQMKQAQRGYFIIKLNREQMTYKAIEIYSGLLDHQNRSTQMLAPDQSLPQRVFDLDSVGPNAKWKLEHVQFLDIDKIRDLMVLELSANWLGIDD